MVQKKTARDSSSFKQGKFVDMKFLIVVRHGEYDEDYNLDHDGRCQIQGLSEKLKEFVNGNETLLLSSPAPRAIQSAQIISEILGMPAEEHDILWSDNDHFRDFDGLRMILRERKSEAEVIIIVTHLEYVEGFPLYFAVNELGMAVRRAPIPLKGEACLLDCSTESFHLISYC